MNICESGNIFVEKAHPAYPHIIDFLVSCCEPVSRTQHVEQYRMDSASLSAATAEGTYALTMIDVILRHFRLNGSQELPIDLERCAALESLAAALEEANMEGAAIDGIDAAPKWLPNHTRHSSLTARLPLPGCLHDLDLTGTSLAVLYSQHQASNSITPFSSSVPSSYGEASSSAVAVKQELEEYGGEGPAEDCVVTRVGGKTTASTASLSRAASAASPTRRVLQLFQSPLPSRGTASPLAPPSVKAFPVAAASECTAGGGRPLISVAVVSPKDVERPLPESITRMMKEEESASRVQIVLQPQLRRFHQFEASHLTSSTLSLNTKSSKSRSGSGVPHPHPDDLPLFYFLQSRQRSQLELVLPALKEFLEPVQVYGAERWILSDVDRSPLVDYSSSAAAVPSSREADRPAILRRLYEPPLSSVQGMAKESCCFGGHEGRTAANRASRFVYKCQVKDGKLREVKERLYAKFDIRADCYYDYLQDTSLLVPNLSLASHVRLRPYQVASIERFRRGHKAHQGVIVLPCGAGKTLTGIGAATTMKRTTIVMCVNSMSVFQWQREFLRWTDLDEADVTVCTAKVKQRPGKVFITTYNMITAKRGRTDGAAAEESQAILQAVTSHPWGLLLLDEVHTALARHFQDVLNTIKYKCVLGLSATLLREDDKIGDLRHLVGPKLYEANWLDLTRAGFLARVECAEVQCPMPVEFLQPYRHMQRMSVMFGCRARGSSADRRAVKRRRSLAGQIQDASDEDMEWVNTDDADAIFSARGQQSWGAKGGGEVLNSRASLLASCNPYKLWCTQALLAFHQQRSPPDKVIIFCDFLADVRFFAQHLHLPFMDQRTSETERANLLQYFQFSDEVNAIILTRVGDVALDLPCASVVIQVSGLGASRRQEAQRLGRILRPKPPSLDNTCAYFYTLVSQDTADIRTSYKRQSWLRDQGFAYRILPCDRVLTEFLRVGGQPCCVGPPQWWYQVPQAGSVGTRSDAQNLAVLYEGIYWAPFSREAALFIEAAFQQGKDRCILRGSELGSDTPRPCSDELGQYPLRHKESWTVTFDSGDAPQTFGTVLIGEGPFSSPLRERRVRRGCLDHLHRCDAPDATHECLNFARSAVLRTRGHREEEEADVE